MTAALLLRELRVFFTAIQFLTRVPIPRWVGFDPAWLQASARHFPLVGFGVGVWGGAALALSAWAFGSPWVAAWLSIAATVWCTGAFHEDGWADTCDGLGGTVSRARALEIMKDSRIGAYGAIGLVLLLGLKAAALAALPLPLAVAATVWAHTVSRTAAVTLIHAVPYAGDPEHAKAKPLTHQVGRGSWAVACAWTLALAAGMVVWQPGWTWALLASLGTTLVVSAGCARWFLHRLGGVTGDTLGATQQLVEVGVLLTWLAVGRQFGP
ncbi:MAG: adenosylcobinamide-GDP ribazoletransferase [Pseudomonadota bacterium]